MSGEEDVSRIPDLKKANNLRWDHVRPTSCPMPCLVYSSLWNLFDDHGEGTERTDWELLSFSLGLGDRSYKKWSDGMGRNTWGNVAIDETSYGLLMRNLLSQDCRCDFWLLFKWSCRRGCLYYIFKIETWKVIPCNLFCSWFKVSRQLRRLKRQKTWIADVFGWRSLTGISILVDLEVLKYWVASRVADALSSAKSMGRPDCWNYRISWLDVFGSTLDLFAIAVDSIGVTPPECSSNAGAL